MDHGPINVRGLDVKNGLVGGEIFIACADNSEVNGSWFWLCLESLGVNRASVLIVQNSYPKLEYIGCHYKFGS